MKRIHARALLNKNVMERGIICIASLILIYLLSSLYFMNHFFFQTEINGINISLKTPENAAQKINSYLKNYQLQIIDQNGEAEIITGKSIGMQYNNKNHTSELRISAPSFQWIGSLFRKHQYDVMDLFTYNENELNTKINELNCFNKKEIIEPQNVAFQYINGCYEVMEEVYGNKIIKDKLIQDIKTSISKGNTSLYVDKKLYYENPKFTINSEKTFKTKNILDKYVSTIIIYELSDNYEMIDGNKISEWLKVDDNLDVLINKEAVMEYVKQLSLKYDTVGTARNFKTSIGKVIEVKGGLYGWKINQNAETKAILENIKLGEVIEREPVYTRMALSRGKDEIGNTYVEINITRQHLWFYKDGKLIAQGPVVTGNPNRGNATVLGIYMLNYKMKGETLSGPGYEAKVTYWMPFYGNIGIHDATWRYEFGGDIYKRKGTHGCVNTPLSLAKAVFENIEEGIPIICYEE